MMIALLQQMAALAILSHFIIRKKKPLMFNFQIIELSLTLLLYPMGL